MSDTTRDPLEVIATSLSELNRNITNLSKDWDMLRSEVRTEIRTRTFSLWLVMAAAFALIITIGLTAYAVGNDYQRDIEENNRRWCPLVSLLVPQPGDPVPTTERGRIIAQRATELYREFRCGA